MAADEAAPRRRKLPTKRLTIPLTPEEATAKLRKAFARLGIDLDAPRRRKRK